MLSIATIVWGALTGTWFGLEAAMKVPILRALTVPILANYPDYFGVSATVQQNAIMKFCFILGTVQLSLACVMSIKRKLTERNLSWIADLGWLIAICAIYFLALYLVIGENIPLAPVGACVGIGFVLVVLFGGMAPGKSFSQGLKAGLADAFTVFLNTISAFGNVMSYIRLFAVGMASLAIAQSFNNMAAGFEGPGHRRRPHYDCGSRPQPGHGLLVRGGARRTAQSVGVFRPAGDGMGRYRLRSV